MLRSTMRSEKIGWQHQDLLDKTFANLNFSLTEFSFVNTFLFRREHDFEVVFGDHLYLKGITRDKHRFIMPLIHPEGISDNELQQVMQGSEFLFPIPDEWAQNLIQNRFSGDYLESDSCYFFTLDKIRHYPGRHLSPKRNLVKQFHDLYTVEAFSLTPDRVLDAKQVLEEWQKEMEESKTATDYYPCQDGLEYMTQLRLKGKIYYIEGRPVGFALGEQIHPDIFDLHFVKADKTYKGIFPFIYQDVALSLPDTVKYMNFEQDLGNPNLRHSKHSYHPDKLVRKWRLTPKFKA